MSSERTEKRNHANAGTPPADAISQKQLLLFEAARLCYDFGLSQREVAQSLGLSPATLTRMLKKAADLGIIRISVQPPEGYLQDVERLTSEAAERLGLEEVIITPTSQRPEIVRKEVGYSAAQWLMSHTRHGMKIGLSGGRTIASMVSFLKRLDRSLEIVQLMGGVSSQEDEVGADVIARYAAAQLCVTCRVLHGPAIFPNVESIREFTRNRVVSEIIDHFDSLDVAVVGIGTLTADNPLIRSGFLSDAAIDNLKSLGCVGDICGHFFDQNGNECKTAIAKTILGVRLEQLAKTSSVCAVAAGAEKTDAIRAACKAGIPKILVTDMSTAEAIVNSRALSRPR